MVKSLLIVAFGLAFGIVLLLVGLLASSAIAAPPQGPTTHNCTSPVSDERLAVNGLYATARRPTVDRVPVSA